MKITYATDVVRRVDGWYVVTTVDGSDRPGAQIGPLPTEALALETQPRLHQVVGQIIGETVAKARDDLRKAPAAAHVAPLDPAADQAPLVIESTPVSGGGWVMRRFMAKG